MDTATTKISTDVHPLSLPDALPIWAVLAPGQRRAGRGRLFPFLCRASFRSARTGGAPARRGQPLCPQRAGSGGGGGLPRHRRHRSEKHTSELQSLMRISYAVFCLKKKKIKSTE